MPSSGVAAPPWWIGSCTATGAEAAWLTIAGCWPLITFPAIRMQEPTVRSSTVAAIPAMRQVTFGWIGLPLDGSAAAGIPSAIWWTKPLPATSWLDILALRFSRRRKLFNRSLFLRRRLLFRRNLLRRRLSLRRRRLRRRLLGRLNCFNLLSLRLRRHWGFLWGFTFILLLRHLSGRSGRGLGHWINSLLRDSALLAWTKLQLHGCKHKYKDPQGLVQHWTWQVDNVFLCNCRREIYISTNCQGKRGETNLDTGPHFFENQLVRIQILKSSQSLRSSFLLTHFLTQSPRQAPRFHWHCVLPQAPSGHILEHILQFSSGALGGSESMKLCPLWSPPTPPKHRIKWYFLKPIPPHILASSPIFCPYPAGCRSLTFLRRRATACVFQQCLIGRFVTEFLGDSLGRCFVDCLFTWSPSWLLMLSCFLQFRGKFMLFTVETASDDSILKLTQLLSAVASHLESSRSSVSPAWPCLPGTCPSAKA